MWMNSSCGGTSMCLPFPSVSLSLSTAKSHRVIWLSEPDATNTELSVGCHSTDVMGPVWCLKTATATPLLRHTDTSTLQTHSPVQSVTQVHIEVTGKDNLMEIIICIDCTEPPHDAIHYLWNCRRSQTFMTPSSPPETINGSFLQRNKDGSDDAQRSFPGFARESSSTNDGIRRKTLECETC